MRCPSCNVPLDSLRVGEIELDECPRCLGTWFDQGELHAVLTSRMGPRRPQPGSRPAPEEPPAPGRLGPCCRCGGLLMEQKTPEYTLASCSRCGGFWVPAVAFKALRAQQPEPAPTPLSRPAPAVALRGRCPACDTTMRPEDRQGQSYHRCPNCGGLHLPRGGLPFLLANSPEPFEPGAQPTEGVRENAGCPVCRAVMQPISWQGKPVRVWACTQCWGTFAPLSAIRQLQQPDTAKDPGMRGVGWGLWRMLDAMVDWLVNPPRRSGPY